MERGDSQSRDQKRTYEKPMLTKHGNLKEVTAEIMVGSKEAAPLGCTRM